VWDHRAVEAARLGRLARLCWALEARRWILAVLNVAAAALFVAGCVGFYWPGLYVGSVSLFLAGSLLFLASALGSALLQHGPSA
jgi:hypothetical protein